MVGSEAVGSLLYGFYLASVCSLDLLVPGNALNRGQKPYILQPGPGNAPLRGHISRFQRRLSARLKREIAGVTAAFLVVESVDAHIGLLDFFCAVVERIQALALCRHD